MQASEEKKATDDIEACCGVPLTDDKQSKRIAVCLMAVGLFLFALGFGFSAKFMFCELRVTWCRNGGICKLTPEENRRMDSIKGSFYTAGPDTDGCAPLYIPAYQMPLYIQVCHIERGILDLHDGRVGWGTYWLRRSGTCDGGAFIFLFCYTFDSLHCNASLYRRSGTHPRRKRRPANNLQPCSWIQLQSIARRPNLPCQAQLLPMLRLSEVVFI